MQAGMVYITHQLPKAASLASSSESVLLRGPCSAHTRCGWVALCRTSASENRHAYLSAGIPVRDMVAACAAGYLESTPLLDLNHMESSGGGLEVCAALHPALDRVVLLQV